MTTRLLLFFCALPLLMASCTDKCEKTQIVRQLRTITLSATEIRGQVASVAPFPMEHPGKIYIKDHYLFINEVQKGIHIYDNSTPSAPKQISFINIPGNGDLAVKDNMLYADSYMDLVAIDISNPENPVEVGRKQEAFTHGVFDGIGWNFNSNTGSIYTHEAYFLEETFETNCEGIIPFRGWWGGPFMAFYETAYLSSSLNSVGSYSGAQANGTTGAGGSMARFTLYDNYLYTVDQRKLQLFDITNLSSPTYVKNIELGWGIETIFPYQDKLFIGSQTGMHIMDNSVPAEPKQLSVFSHVRACDPVVVHNNIAYVTLRTGAVCGGTQNRLELVDISNPRQPTLIKSYDMQNPAGLSINFPTLFLCEGDYGLKVFDVSDKYAIDKNLLSHHKGMEAYDVISLEKNLIMIGKDGLYQYNATDPKNLLELSHIPVKKPAIIIETKQ